jgi:hypothetical protein
VVVRGFVGVGNALCWPRRRHAASEVEYVPNDGWSVGGWRSVGIEGNAVACGGKLSARARFDVEASAQGFQW